jgi:hypothetical protein
MFEWANRVGTAVPGALALSIALTAAAAAETLSFEYRVEWGHITLIEASVSLTEEDGRYSLRGQGRTEGAFALLFDWRGRSRTEGIAVNNERRPLRHSHEGVRSGKKQLTRVEWSGDDAPRTETDPPPDPDEMTDIPARSTIGTSDPFTALMRVLDNLNEKGRCEGDARVWDGRRRYDLVVEHGGAEELVADRSWAYAGPAVKCRLSIARIGGFWRESSPWRAKDDAERWVWAAGIAEGRFVPVRFEVETGLGIVVGRLKPVDSERIAEDQAERNSRRRH